MWNLKGLSSNVFFKINCVLKENVKMASKKATVSEYPKATKKVFFNHSESVSPDNYGKNVIDDSCNSNSKLNDSVNKKVMRRSSMICSEGFDKYTFDCRRGDIPSRSAGLELDVTATACEPIHNQTFSVSDDKCAANTQTFKSSPIEYSLKKPILFKSLSTVQTSTKNASLIFKRVPEETIPMNIPLSFKRVPEETVPVTNYSSINVNSNKAPFTNIPLSFSSIPEESWIGTSSSKTSSNRSAPIKTSPFSFKHITEEPSSARSSPVPLKHVSEEKIVNRASSFNVPSQSLPLRINSPYVKQVSDHFVPERNNPLSFKHLSKDISMKSTSMRSNSNMEKASDNFGPERNTPLSFKHVQKDTVQPSSIRSNPPPEQHASSNFDLERIAPLSFKQISIDSSAHAASVKNNPSPVSQVSDNFVPERSGLLSFKHIPKEGASSNYLQAKSIQNVSEESITHRSKPLSKYVPGENTQMRNASVSAHFPEKPTTLVRDMPLSFQPVAKESINERNSSSYKDIPDEPIPVRNAPLSLKPILTKHMSLLKKKSPSIKSNIIKRDSLVHPGRIDMQGSLCIDGRFQNPWPTWRPPTFTNILKFGVTRNKSKVPPKQELDLILPIVKQKFSKLSIPDDGIQVTWIGHSTVLVQMHGLNILTDPIFSDRASPSQVVGPKRYRDPPCTIHDLPHINAVVISHSHYDHLDYNTVTLLNARFGSEIRWFVPLGLQTWMEDVGCENVVELDWWEENCVPEHSDTFFVFTPAQHWSKRTIGDDNKVLWGSWCILGPKYKFFFAGDTGYCDVFKQIGRVHGPFDLSAIPIGAYEPRWFMKYQHINPEEAVKIHMDIKSKRSLAIHWGTFCLANEYYLDPPVKLREGLDKYEIPPELFFTMKHGESKIIAQNNLVKRPPLSDRNV